jgi:RNA polymerase sigma-70 factor (ECF subfamily)
MMGQKETPRDAGLVSGEDTSFAHVYDAHVDEVYRFVHRRCRDHALAEDITQETFMAALRSMDDLQGISIGWLITVARNRLIDVLRKRTQYARKIRLVAQVEPDVLDIELAERLRVERAFDELTVDHRLILTLHYVDGLTVPALAKHLGRSVKSIEGLVTRARRELRAELDRETDEAMTEGDEHG